MPTVSPNDYPSDEEETRIQAHIAADPEDPAHWTSPARPAAEVHPEILRAHRDGELASPSPGRILKVTLESAGLSQRQLAKAMGRPPNVITEIVHVRKSITAQTALELEEALGVPAAVWMRAEADYQLALARRKRRSGE